MLDSIRIAIIQIIVTRLLEMQLAVLHGVFDLLKSYTLI